METLEIEKTRTDDPARQEQEAPALEACSLAMLHAPQEALAAARRLYQRNRAGVRFFCENRRVVPVDQLEALGEFGEFGEFGGVPPAVLVASSSSPEAARSTM